VPDLNAYQPDADGDPLLVFADVTGAQWPVTINWGDGSTDQIPAEDDDEDIEHRYRQGGSFNVTATDVGGGTASGTVSIPFAEARAGATPLAAGGAKGDPDAVVLGPGLLYVGLASAADPADATTPPAAADFRAVGYTEEGSSFAYETTSEDITVAEENDPIRTVPTGTSSTLSFSMAEMTWENLLLALNAGPNAGTTPPTMPTAPLEPVEPGEEVRVKLIWDSDYGSRWIFRQCVQSGTLTIDRKKAPDKGLLPVEFKCEKPASGAPFAVFPSADGLV
jgi:hypothetical protein